MPTQSFSRGVEQGKNSSYIPLFSWLASKRSFTGTVTWSSGYCSTSHLSNIHVAAGNRSLGQSMSDSAMMSGDKPVSGSPDTPRTKTTDKQFSGQQTGTKSSPARFKHAAHRWNARHRFWLSSVVIGLFFSRMSRMGPEACAKQRG